ncbi:uncharacterized protein [Clytia hemisphaerica]|uniref:uncharacterized protein n=1 Tax=Clytia hemisphaerica TaxID=252671 RepID=UPI0034D48896
MALLEFTLLFLASSCISSGKKFWRGKDPFPLFLIPFSLEKMTANDPLTCGFLKVKVFNLLVRDCYKLGKLSACTVDKSNTYEIHCREIKEYFCGVETFDINSAYYAKNLVGIRKILLDIGKSTSVARPPKEEILNTFSEKIWKRLSQCEKELHSLKDCKGCLSFRTFKTGLSLFPVSKKARVHYAKAKKNGLIREPKRTPLADISNFTKQQQDKIKRQVIKECETIKNASAINRVLTTNQSFRKRGRVRSKESLETDEQAENRFRKEQEKIKSGKKKPNNHGNERNYDWNREGCLREVKKLKDGDVINYSVLGKTYGLRNKNGKSARNRGQLVKQFLIKNKIDVSRFRPAKINRTSKARKARLKYVYFDISSTREF